MTTNKQVNHGYKLFMTTIKRVKQGYKLFITTIGLKRLSISLLVAFIFEEKKKLPLSKVVASMSSFRNVARA